MDIRGWGVWQRLDPTGLYVIEEGEFTNLVTEVGDTYFGDGAARMGTLPAAITGMQLGTGTSIPTKTGAGAAIGAYITGSAVALEAGFPTTETVTLSRARRMNYQCLWAAGVATSPSGGPYISEVVLINQAVATNAAAPAANTISRILLDPVINKISTEPLRFKWAIDAKG